MRKIQSILVNYFKPKCIELTFEIVQKYQVVSF